MVLREHEPLQSFEEPVASRLEAIEALPDFSDSRDLQLALRHVVANVPEPERVLAQLERFLENVGSNAELRHFCFEDVRRLDMLLTLLAGSAFLSEILIRDPDLFRKWAVDQNDARRRNREMTRTAVEMDRAIIAATASVQGYEEKKLALRRFHKRETFRIAACDILGLWDMPAVTLQLSQLADAIIRTSLEVASEKTGVVPAGLAIAGMGKLGGSELNYSSDIDLLFVAGSDPRQYNSLGAAVIDVLGSVTAEGFLYRVDMRLRPWGGAGALVHTVDAFLEYLRRHGEDWEKQALLKARILAGNVLIGRDFIDRVTAFIHEPDGDPRESVLRMKQRIETELSRKGRLWGDVKQGQGSIRDVEFTVQYLQLAHGKHHPNVLTQNTVKGLGALHADGLLSTEDYRVLNDGYAFLRVVEHHLQLHHNRQTHAIPRDPARCDQLARRLSFEGDFPGKELVAIYEQHAEAIRAVFDRIVGGATTDSSSSPSGVEPHLTRMAPSYRDTFSGEEIRLHAAMARRLTLEHPLEFYVETVEPLKWRITVVSFDHLGMLSIITGLLQASGLDILDGHIFTYEPLEGDVAQGPKDVERQRIVDVFTVRSLQERSDTAIWERYERDLQRMISELEKGNRSDVQGELAERIASATERSTSLPQLYPVDISIDNETDNRYTVLHIDAPDTTGFLYELTNALTLLDVDIARVDVQSVGERVRDTLYVTSLDRRKLTDSEDQTRIRVATVLVQHFIHLLPAAPNPASALKQFRILIGDLLVRPDWLREISSLERPEVLDALARVLGVSDFLWADFLRMQHANIFPLVEDVESLTVHQSMRQMEEALEREMSEANDAEGRIEALNRFKDGALFRIDMRYILGRIGEFGAFSSELSDLAEVIVRSALEENLAAERAICGDPSFEDGQICPLTLCALGKFGGRELGFASDIELLFIYEANGTTTGPETITNAEFFDRVARRFLESIRSKRDGIFEIDLRLRPYGRSGSLAVSVAAFRRYFDLEGAAWPYERQLIVKLRPVGGDVTLGQHVLSIRDEILTKLGPFDVAAMRAMRERQLRHIVRPGTLNAKYSPGGLVDIEYLVQGLQITYCNRHPDLLDNRNTREALRRLHELGLIAAPDYRALDAALIFIRRLIDGLRMARGNAKDLTLPEEGSQEALYLARRLEYSDHLTLIPDLLGHMRAVERINSKLLA